MVQTETKKEYEEPPSQRPPHLWEDLPWERRSDWRWQLSHSLNALDERRQIIHPMPGEEIGVVANHCFRLDITPYFVSLIAPRSTHRLPPPRAGPFCLWSEQPQIMESNTLPSLCAGFGTPSLTVESEGAHDTTLINEILNLAIQPPQVDLEPGGAFLASEHSLVIRRRNETT